VSIRCVLNDGLDGRTEAFHSQVTLPTTHFVFLRNCPETVELLRIQLPFTVGRQIPIMTGEIV